MFNSFSHIAEREKIQEINHKNLEDAHSSLLGVVRLGVTTGLSLRSLQVLVENLS